jgi:hypothetical protein
MQQGIYNSDLGCTYGAVSFSLKTSKTKEAKTLATDTPAKD